MKLILPKGSAYAMTNIQLNAVEPWKGRRCTRCARRYPDTVLNVQGAMRGEALQCVNRRSCDAFRKQVRG